MVIIGVSDCSHISRQRAISRFVLSNTNYLRQNMRSNTFIIIGYLDLTFISGFLVEIVHALDVEWRCPMRLSRTPISSLQISKRLSDDV